MNKDWIDAWLDSVVSGKSTMSQRVMSSIEIHGGLDRVVSAAQARGVHLVQLTDDHGKELVAASLHPFRTLC
jgi:hypothetical protein